MDNLVGQRFGRLVVIEQIAPYRYRCLCDCGNYVELPRCNLLSGHVKSCGCLVREDLTGKRFGMLTVLEFAESRRGNDGEKERFWKCQCDCGNITYVSTNSLKGGNTKSCGCLSGENLRANKKYNKYDFFENYVVGYTSNHNLPFYADIEDYNKIKDICWYDFKRGGMIVLLGAWVPTEKGDHKPGVPMHRFLGYKNCDHINRNELDNRKENLRPCNSTENARNRSKGSNNKSGFVGIWWDKEREKWQAFITIGKKRKHLGRYSNKEDAIIVRLKAEKEYFGEFAPQRHLFEQYGI